ncbi:MAG TPA: zinc-binding dehydrogenase [Planctomycetota bacterium]|nr:zinc-binding dehydrogenase [Planctomycetota bacterium]
MQGVAIQISGPGRAGLVPIAEEGPLAEDAIEGPALASAISPGTEIGWAFASKDTKHFPSSPGYAMVFRVERAGAASGFKPGDVAFAMAGHRSWVRCPGASAWHVPAGLDPADASLARLAGVSWSTLTTTGARPPVRVAVTGLGIVGNLAAQVFAAAGYQVLACDPVAGRRELLAGLGIELRERLPQDDPAWAEQIALVVECSGHEGAVLDACKVVRKGGEVAMVGVPWAKRTDIPAFELLNVVFHKYVVLRSGWEWQVAREPAEFRAGSIRENIVGALDGISRGRIRTAGLYKRVKPADCEAVYRELQEQRGGPVTAVFVWP